MQGQLKSFCFWQLSISQPKAINKGTVWVPVFLNQKTSKHPFNYRKHTFMKRQYTLQLETCTFQYVINKKRVEILLVNKSTQRYALKTS